MTNQTHREATVTALQPRLTADLDNLPERLDDRQLAMVEAMAAEPLPTLPPCDERHFVKCLRAMLAVLPKQNTDDLGGELFVELYRRQLGEYPREAISYMVERVTAKCRWFPTIAECLEVLQNWRRNDDAVMRQRKAQSLAFRERDARRTEQMGEAEPMTQEQVDSLTPSLRRIGLSLGYLVAGEDGTIRPA